MCEAYAQQASGASAGGPREKERRECIKRMRRKFYEGKDGITEELIAKLVKEHMGESEDAFRYYLGDVKVDKGVIPEGRPDNQANTNIAKYIVDTATGYFMGMPPVYKFSDEKAESVLRKVFDENDERTVDYEIAENMSIAGAGYELIYIGEDKRIRFTAVDPRNCFIICDGSVEERPLAGIRYWKDGDCIAGEAYMPYETLGFGIKNGKAEFNSRIFTPFSLPNLHEYKNNRFMCGDFDMVRDNIDAYNKALSNVADDLQSIANAYLVLSGFEQPDEETLDILRRERVIGLPCDGGAEYITKNISDSAIENHKRTLKQDILQVAQVPDLSDESFASAASGISLKYKMWGIDQLFAKKCAGMEKGLFYRMERIREAIAMLENSEICPAEEAVSVQFVRNMPRDFSEEISNAAELSGIISRRTVFEMLEPVSGIAAAEEEARVLGAEEV